MSNLNVRLLDPPTHSSQFEATVGRFNIEWPLKETGLVFAFLMRWMVFSVYYVGCMIENINVLFAE